MPLLYSVVAAIVLSLLQAYVKNVWTEELRTVRKIDWNPYLARVLLNNPIPIRLVLGNGVEIKWTRKPIMGFVLNIENKL
jgi:hypothetical protein